MDTENAITTTTDRQQEASEEKQRRNLEKLRNELGSVICAALGDSDEIKTRKIAATMVKAEDATL